VANSSVGERYSFSTKNELLRFGGVASGNHVSGHRVHRSTPDRAMTGMIVTAPGCAPLLIDTCGGLELARQLQLVGFERTEIGGVIVTHRHLDHAGGIQELFFARMPLDIYALLDTHEGIAAVTKGSFPE
jgi:glyoxylase-like metal-dependent hydrolase (beta-lactamase superfamily II)